MGVHRAKRSTRIEASPECCFEAITDYESFCDWQSAVKSVDVLERDAEGRGLIVEYGVSVLTRPVRYRLRYGYDPPLRIWWDFVEGEPVRSIDGGYDFEPDGDGTIATYRLGIDPGVPAPGFLVKRANDVAMRASVDELRREAERRASL